MHAVFDAPALLLLFGVAQAAIGVALQLRRLVGVQHPHEKQAVVAAGGQHGAAGAETHNVDCLLVRRQRGQVRAHNLPVHNRQTPKKDTT